MGVQRISSQLVPLFLAYARSRGVSAERFITRFNLPPDAETQSEVYIEVPVLVSLLDAIAAELEEPELGLVVATAFRRGTYALFEFCARNAPDVRGAILRMVRYASIVNEAVSFTFREDDRGGVFEHRLAGLGRHGSEFTMAVIYLSGCELTGKQWTPGGVWFAHPAPPDLAPLVALFGTTDLAFERDANGLVFPSALLDVPLGGADPALLQVLEREAARRARAPSAEPTALAAEAAAVVEQSLELGPPRIEAVAEALGTSARTLQRRLGEEGVTFQQVVEATRQRLGRQHAERGELTSVQIAFALGYADVASYLRAFKRWTGMTQEAYRASRGR